jgi:hypothetical protein
MRKQPLENQTLYSELVDRLTAMEAHRTIGHLKGTFVTKTIKGERYHYFQHSEPGGRKRQIYLGRKDEALERVLERFEESRPEASMERSSVERLCAQLRAGGALVTDSASARVLRALSDSGLFRLGGVLVGTHAFTVIGNRLGVSWSSSLRTQDIDVAAERVLRVAVDDSTTADVPDALESLEMGFLPVPGLDRKSPSTSYKVRGQSLRVDVLTPLHGGGETGVVEVPRLKASAKSLRFLDYLIERPVTGAVVDGGGVFVRVPDPARFALLKLILSGERSATEHSKREKDLRQAGEVLAVLLDERPGDVELAWEELERRGRGWIGRAREGTAALEAVAPEVAARLAR